MARRINELFIGTEHLNTEGRSIKHEGLIREFGTPNIKKVNDNPIMLKGTDLETNYKTAELKLLGTWNGSKYQYYTEDFLVNLFWLVKNTYWEGKREGRQIALAHWNKLDPFVLFKQFLLIQKEQKQERAMKRYGKIGGKWNRQEGKWEVTPVVEVQIKYSNKTYKFGIKSVMRSSIQFYFYDVNRVLDNGTKPLSTLWAYDIAALFQYGLEKEMLSREDIFPYYSKVSEDAHKIDWERFITDKHYRHNVVLYSNKLDARAVYDLGMHIQEQFKKAFGYYPNTLISTGSLARASIVATLKNKYYGIYGKNKESDALITNDIKSIGINNYRDAWSIELGDDSFKDLMCLMYESYSGGYIESIRYGFIENAYYSDIASAYPGVIQNLWDLRDAKITHGEGEPPEIPYSYCLIRGDVKIPLNVQYHPLTIKHFVHKDTNIRAVGEYRAAYTKNERDFLISLGATFSNETWYNIETTGELSPIAEVVKEFVALRKRLIAAGNSAEYMAKISANSVYGILFEAVDTWEEDINFNVYRNGYRGGEFLNPLFASIITSETRILISKAANGIVKNGGNPILIMTDAIFWEGTKEMIPEKFVRDVKTLGYFETPQPVKNMACLGTGRYSYLDPIKGYITTKNRGLNVTDIHRPDGVDVGTYNWINALKIAEHQKSLKIKVKVRMLISVGVALHNSKYSVNDLGLVVEEDREVDLITGLSKRFLTKSVAEIMKDVTQITRSSVMTSSIYLAKGMAGDGELNDQTLPFLRSKVMKLDYITAKTKDLANRSKASAKYNKKHREKYNKIAKDKYQMLKDLGFDSKTCTYYSKRSYETIHKFLEKEGKLDGNKKNN